MATMRDVFSAYDSRCATLGKSDHAFAKGVAWIAGQLVPLHDAQIPLMDQGFLRSDLTYDVLSVWDGNFFRLKEHIARLDLSCSKIRLKLPLPREDIESILHAMVAQSGIRDAYVMLVVTRGMKSVREAALTREPLVNNLYMWVMPYVWVMPPSMQLQGNGSAIIARTVRRIPPGAFDPTVKNLQWGDLTRAMFEAQDRQAHYPFLTDGDANLTEGSGFNVCIVKEGVLYTPDRGVLEGLTRKSVFEAAQSNGIQYKLQVVPITMVYEADEIFMCTTAGGIMPITFLDGRPIGDGKIGPVTTKIWDTYWNMHLDSKYAQAVKYSVPSRL